MGLTHLVDTSVLIDASTLVLDPSARLATSVICLGELQAGVVLAVLPERRAAPLRRLTAASSTLVALPADAPWPRRTPSCARRPGTRTQPA